MLTLLHPVMFSKLTLCNLTHYSHVLMVLLVQLVPFIVCSTFRWSSICRYLPDPSSPNNCNLSLFYMVMSQVFKAAVNRRFYKWALKSSSSAATCHSCQRSPTIFRTLQRALWLQQMTGFITLTCSSSIEMNAYLISVCSIIKNTWTGSHSSWTLKLPGVRIKRYNEAWSAPLYHRLNATRITSKSVTEILRTAT